MTTVNVCAVCFLCRPADMTTCPFCSEAASWTPTDTHRNTWPASLTYDTRVDIKMRDGTVFKNCRAYTWSWGEARETTITYWRLAA